MNKTVLQNNGMLDSVDDILSYLEVSLVDVILEDPIVIYSKIFNLPDRSIYQKFIEDKGNFTYAELFNEENAKVTQHIAVYHANENLFKDVLMKAVTGNESERTVPDWEAIMTQVAKHFLGILVSKNTWKRC